MKVSDSIADSDAKALYRTAVLILLNVAVTSVTVFHFLPRYVPRQGPEEVLTVILFVAVGVWSMITMSRSVSVHGLSTHALFWFFGFWFFFLAPFTAYLIGDSDFAAVTGGHSEYLAIVLLWLGSFEYFHKRAPKLAMLHKSPIAGLIYEISSPRLLLVATLFAIWILVYAWANGVAFLVLRLGSSDDVQGSRLPIYLLTSFFARPAVTIAFLIGLIKLKYAPRRRWFDWLMVGYLGVLALVTNFPTSIARFYLFAIVVSVLMVLSRRLVTHGPFVGVFLAVSVVASSILHVFRGIRQGYDLTHSLNFEYLHEGHFASFSNLAHIVNYVNEQGIRWGQQLLAAMLSWVPRSLWESKPVGSSEFIVKNSLEWEQGLTFANISMPAIGEFFLDFHVVGVLLGAALFGVLSANIDTLYRERAANPLASLPTLVVVVYITGLWIFINRGDFQSAIPYAAGITVAGLSVVRLTTTRRFS